MMRKRLYNLIQSVPYSFGMIALIVVSIIPLAFHTESELFRIIDACTTSAFIFDYVARWMTADFEISKHFPFARYPMQPMAIIDLVSILPSITAISSGFRLLKIFRLMRTLRVFRAFKLARYSRNIQIIIQVFKTQRDSLMTVLALAVAYIVVSALVIFNVEPQTFDTFFDAIYWAAVSLTTMGYGDIYPVSTIGRIVTIISSLFGIAIVALPAGILTAGYMNAIQKEDESNGKKENTDLAPAETDDKNQEKSCKDDRDPDHAQRTQGESQANAAARMLDSDCADYSSRHDSVSASRIKEKPPGVAAPSDRA